MSDLSVFANLADHLSNPFALIGFILFAVFLAAIKYLVKPAFIRKLSGKASEQVVKKALSYVFWVTIIVVVCLIALAAFSETSRREAVISHNQIEANRMQGLAAAMNYCAHVDSYASDSSSNAGIQRECAKAVQALAALSDVSLDQKQDALNRLAKGDTGGARAIFSAVLAQKEAEGRSAMGDASEMARSLGALLVEEDPPESLQMFKRSVELDSENVEGWADLGVMFVRAGRQDDAEEAFRNVIAKSHLRDSEWPALGYSYLGSVYAQRGDFVLDEQMQRKALDVSNDARYSWLTPLIRLELGSVMLNRGELDKAEKEINQAIDGFSKTCYCGGLADAFITMAQVYEQRGDFAGAEGFVVRGVLVAWATSSQSTVARGLLTLSAVYLLEDRFLQADLVIRQALTIDKMLGIRTGVASAYLELGELFSREGHLPEAMALDSAALSLDEETGSELQGAAARLALGFVYLKEQDFSTAEWSLRLAIHTYKGKDAQSGLADCYVALALAYYLRGFDANADALIKRALSTQRASIKHLGIARLYLALGGEFLKGRQLGQAQSVEFKALDLYQAAGDQAGMAAAAELLGIIYDTAGRSSMAEQSLRNAIALFTELGLNDKADNSRHLLEISLHRRSPVLAE
jgi:protein O-GlcNAc transferase